jgi:hypothetical protein
MLEHYALIYDGEDQFLAAADHFLREAAGRAEPALAVTSPEKIDALRRALGEAAEQIEFADHAEWYRTPTQALTRYRGFLERSLAAGAAWARILGEPVWAGDADVKAWSRYESLLNLVFSGSPLTVVCPYAADSLDPEVLEHACATHPHTLERGMRHPSPTFCDPGSYILAPPGSA